MDLRIIVIVLISTILASDFWNRRKLLLNHEGYDERQTLFIGKAFKLALYSSFALNILLGFLHTFYPRLLSISFVLSCLAILPLTVIVVVMILTDAFFPIKIAQHKKHQILKRIGVCSGITACICLLTLFKGSQKGFFQYGGDGNMFLLFLAVLSISSVTYYKIWKYRHEVEE